MTETLCYVPEPVISVLGGLQARYLPTSCRGTFDACLQRGLHALGWREGAYAEVLPKLDPVAGRDSLLIARRPGSHIRLCRPTHRRSHGGA